jgi:hypothetical protein
MKNLLLILCCILAGSLALQSQTMEELEARKAAIQGKMDALKEEMTKVETSIKALTPEPAWTKGFAGTLGFNFNQLDNWVVNPNPNARTSSILIATSGFANLKKSRYFWRNSGLLNLGWQKLQLDKSIEDGSEYQPNVDVFQATSLFGYNLTKTIAASALGEFRSSVIQNAFNPAYLDLGIGATWKPMNELVVVFHPLNYNFIFAQEGTDYTSSLGCKIVADFNKQLFKNFRFRSNLSSFLSYQDVPELSNVTWTNGLSFNVWKGLGVGLEYALRVNRQETKIAGTKDLQSYFVLGLSYAL